jgi:hypothetical protein
MEDMRRFARNRFPVPSIFYAILCLTLICKAQAQTTNSVTSGNFIDYTINGLPDPPFTLQRGVTYMFQLSNVGIHPFWIKTNTGFGGAGAFSTGVINNGATSGNVTFTVPVAAPNSMLYQCGNHGGMTGSLTIVTPVTPPTVKIVHINVGQFITVKSTGTNGWSVIPEFNCGLSSTSWSAINPFTNIFNTATNTTTFPRLEAICGSTNVLIRIRNQF